MGLLGGITPSRGDSLYVQGFNFRIVFTGHIYPLLFDKHNSMAEFINRQNPNLVLFGGDLIPGTWKRPAPVPPEKIDSQWNIFYGMANSLTSPYITVPGNHDVSANTGDDIPMMNKMYLKYEPIWYKDPTWIISKIDSSVQALVIPLNSLEIRGSKVGHGKLGPFLDSMWAKGKVEIQKAKPDIPVILFTHLAFFKAPEWSRVVTDLHGRNVVVISGDDLAIEDYTISGIRYLACGTDYTYFRWLNLNISNKKLSLTKHIKLLGNPKKKKKSKKLLSRIKRKVIQHKHLAAAGILLAGALILMGGIKAFKKKSYT